MLKRRFLLNAAASAAFLLVAGTVSAQTIAYNVPVQPGNQAFTGSLGIDFNVVTPIQVTSLGVFDANADGFSLGTPGRPAPTVLQVAIFDRNTGLQVGPTATFSALTPGTLINGSRFFTLPTPILLPVGVYSVVAVGFNNNDLNGNATAGGTFLPPTTNTGGGLISFPGTSRYDSVANPVLSFPTTTYPSPTVFLAGTFQFVPLTALTLTKAFSAPFFGIGSVSNLTFTITNTNAVAQTGVAFNDFLPGGLLIASVGTPVNNCGGLGTLTATAGTNAIQLLNGTVGANATCTITVPVVGTTPGVLNNVTSAITSAQTPLGTPAAAPIILIPADAFQVRYASNLAIGDSVINFSNSGTSSTTSFPAQDGNICVNAYAFSPDEQLISCCSCLVTPDGLNSLSARNDLISNTLTPAVPTSIAVKLLASAGTVVNGVTVCDASTVTPAGIAAASGLLAWGTTIHASAVSPGAPAGTFGVTETAFTPARLSAAELTRITTLCALVKTNGSGFGICRSCRLGGLGAGKQ